MRNFFLRLDPWLKRYLRFSSYTIEWLCVGMFMLMLVSYVWNIFLRVAFNKGVTWHQEISVMAAMWVYFAAYSLVSKGRFSSNPCHLFNSDYLHPCPFPLASQSTLPQMMGLREEV